MTAQLAGAFCAAAVTMAAVGAWTGLVLLTARPAEHLANNEGGK